MFEKIAVQRAWPKEDWVTLIQGSLTGKAQEAYVALDLAQSDSYDIVRQAVLKAYELVLEAYRQWFRTERLQSGQTYLDFARQQEAAFDNWLRASEVFTFKELRELIVLEQFKQSLPKVMQTYLNDADAKTVVKAAEAADNYVLIHKDSWRDKPSGQAKKTGEFEKRHSDKTGGSWHSPMNPQNGGQQHKPSPFQGDIICHYCRKPGQIRSRCPALQKKDTFRGEAGRSVPSSLIGLNPVHRPVETVDKADMEMFDGFLSGRTVAVKEGAPETPVTVLRDTAQVSLSWWRVPLICLKRLYDLTFLLDMLK